MKPAPHAPAPVRREKPPRRASVRRGVSRPALAWFLALACLAPSCAYYNTFYLARKYYLTATAGYPYPVEKASGAQAGSYQKSIDYSKKLMADYPKSKWVDDAYLMWARSLLGKGDPLQTATMLQDFSVRFPDSPLKREATFYLGVAYRQGHKYREALVALDEYLEKAPRGEMAPYAHFERARALLSLERPVEAAQAAGRVIEGFPTSPLVTQARAVRAEAALAGGDPAAARADYAELGLHARDDEQRLVFLLHEADCLESARDYPKELGLLSGALSHELKPVHNTAGGVTTDVPTDRYGRLTLRIGTVHLLAGRTDQALASYKTVIEDYPNSPLGAEAQYRIGYAYETVLDDFESARKEYAKVREQSLNSAFYDQANVRLVSLERLARYRAAGVDSANRSVEAGFLLAEQYLFQLGKPERALDAYAAIAHEHPGTPMAGKAINAQAWVLRRKLDQPAAADSLLWAVVRGYPATEAQIAARDYLEAAGQQVPDGLIRMPEVQLAAGDSAMRLTPPPEGSTPLGAANGGAGRPETPVASRSDSLPLDPLRPSIGPMLPAPAASAGRLRPQGGPGIQPLPPFAGPVRTPPATTAPAAAPRARAARAGGQLDDPPVPPPDSTETAPRDTSRVRP